MADTAKNIGSSRAERPTLRGRAVSGPGTLEFRLERFKRVSNASLDFLKRLYDRRSIAELYIQGEIDLHMHFFSGHGVACARYSAGEIEEAQSVGCGINLKHEIALVIMKTPVLVWVGEIAKNLSPIASTVRLQSLDCCYMRGIEAIEPSAILPKRESLLLAFDRELRAIYDATRVQDGKLVNKVIHSCSQIVTNFTNQHAKDKRHAEITGGSNLDFARSVRIEIPHNRILLRLSEDFDSLYKISKVFACPPTSGDSSI